MLRFLLKWNLLTSPIYFLPFLPIPLTYGIKYILFVSLLLASFFWSFKVRKNVARLTFLLIISYIPSFFLDFADSWIILIHYVATFSILGMNTNYVEGIRISKRDYLHLIFIYSLPLLGFFGIVDISGPLEHDNVPFFVSGLTFKSTGWSNALSLLIGFVLFIERDRLSYYTILFILILLCSQLISGGRMGFGMSLIILIFYLSKRKHGIHYIISIAGVCFWLLGSFSEEISMLFRINNSLSSTTSNRYDQYFLVPEVIMDMGLFTGLGFGGSFGYFDIVEFHNSFLRTLIDFGLFHFLVVLFFTVYPFRYLFRLILNGSVDLVHVVLFVGILIMLVEPRMIWGNLLPGMIWIYFWKLCVEEKRI